MTLKQNYRILKVKGYNKNFIPNQGAICLQRGSNFITWFLVGGGKLHTHKPKSKKEKSPFKRGDSLMKKC